MTENHSTSVPGLNELLGLLGTSPLAGLGRSFDQLRNGVGDLVHTVEHVNTTMRELNRIAERLNGLIDTVEEPIRQVAPGLVTLAETLSTPALAKMPDELTRVLGVLGDLAAKLQPLGQLADAAGGMLGLRNLAGGLLGGAAPATTTPTPPAPASPAPAARTQAPSKKAAAKKAAAAKPVPAKKAAAKPAAKKAAAKKAAAKKAAAKKAAAEKAPATRAPAKRPPAGDG